MIQGKQQKYIWLDCDPGTDDALALYLAGFHENSKLVALSSVHGNQSVDVTNLNILKLLKLAGMKDIPVFKGTSQPLVRESILCDQTHGRIFGADLPEIQSDESINDQSFTQMFQFIKSFKEQIVFVATGCLTNLAILITKFPEVKQYIESIAIMGGAQDFGNTTPASEFNIITDPEASEVVFQCGLPLTVVPLEVTHTVLATDEVLERIRENKTNFSQQVIQMITFYQKYYIEMEGFSDPPLHDPCAVMYVLRPDLFKTQLVNVEIQTKSKFCDGRTVVDFQGVTKREKNVNWAYEIQVAQFWNVMLGIIKKASDNSENQIN